jgi:hypothetical protein
MKEKENENEFVIDMSDVVLKRRMRELSGEWFMSEHVKKLSEVRGERMMMNGCASAYIDMESSNEDARIRARFRFDTIHSNHNLHKWKQRSDEECKRCDVHAAETRHHILLSCSAYNTDRFLLAHTYFGTTMQKLTLSEVLGESGEYERKLNERMDKRAAKTKKEIEKDDVNDEDGTSLNERMGKGDKKLKELISSHLTHTAAFLRAVSTRRGI